MTDTFENKTSPVPQKTAAWLWVPFSLVLYFIINVFVTAMHMIAIVLQQNLSYAEQTQENILMASVSVLKEQALLMTFEMQIISLLIFGLIFKFVSKRYAFDFGFSGTFTPKHLKTLFPVPMLSLFLSNGFVLGLGILSYFLPSLKDYLESYSSHIGMLLTNDPQTLILVFLTVVIGAPLMEEILFRGIFYGVLRKHLKPVYAMLLSSVLFGLVHGQLIQIVYATFLGCVLTLLMIKYRTLKAAIVAHMIFNFIGGFMPTLLNAFLDENHPIIILYSLALLIFYIVLIVLYRKDIAQLKTTVKELLEEPKVEENLIKVNE